jgi:hypothetical protein
MEHASYLSRVNAFDAVLSDGLKLEIGLYRWRKRLIGEYDRCSSSPLADDGLLQTSASHNRPKQRLETIMIFGRQTDLHKQLSSKRPLFSHRMVEDDRQNKIVEPVQDEQMRLGDPPTKRDEPMNTQSNS